MEEPNDIDEGASQSTTHGSDIQTANPNSFSSLTRRPKDNATEIQEHQSASESQTDLDVSATDLGIRQDRFGRIVNDILEDLNAGVEFDQSALDTIHRAAEDYVVEIFYYAGIGATEDGRHTLQDKDMKAALEFLKDTER